jgi:hypothetical protein
MLSRGWEWEENPRTEWRRESRHIRLDGYGISNRELRSSKLGCKLISLKVFAKLASAFLLVWLFAAPAMACLLPIAQLTQEEKACCRSMAGMCDDMAKNTSHSCCQKVQTHHASYVVAKASFASVQQLQVTPARFAIFNSAVPAVTTARSLLALYGSPPGHTSPTLPELIVFRI